MPNTALLTQRMRRTALLFLVPMFALRAAAPGAETADNIFLISSKHTNATPLVAGSNDTNIVKVVAAILSRQHYQRKPINDDVSSKFLDRYLEALDNLRLYFLQSDVAEFETYRRRLDDLTVEEGNTEPARVIFNRFRERLKQQYDYVTGLLKTNNFEFDGEDRYVTNRKEEPRPRDLDEARKLWRDRLRYEYLQEKLNKEKPAQIVTNLTKRYTRVLRTLNEFDNGDVLEIYLTALAHIFDPHSDYMGKSALENFSINMKLSLFGIGAVLRSEDGFCKIDRLQPESPAERSKKLKPNDKIIAVAQATNPAVDVVDMKLNKVVELIRGPKDTEVRLTIIPAADPDRREIVSLVRDEIKLEDQAAKARIFELPQGRDAGGSTQSVRVGVIDLPSFYSSFELEGRKGAGEPKSTTADVAKLLRKLVQEKVKGVILDLRRNGGGSLEEAINLSGLFIKEGPVVQVRDSSERVFIETDPEPNTWYDGPLVVLTSRFSASASEILAGALQDYGRAVVVGDSGTHGKGTVQSLLQLAPILRSQGLLDTNPPGAVKITIRKFYRASGESTQLRGVTPDIVLPSVNNHFDVGEGALDNPLEWDTIRPAVYEKVNRVAPHLDELKKRSRQRLETDPDFAFIREEIERYQKLKAEKSVSLNEAVRLKEKEESDARTKARKRELAARPEPPGKVYEIKLKDVDLPGLPPPLTRTNTASATATNAPKSAAVAAEKSAAVQTARADKPVKTPAADRDDEDDDGEPDDADIPAVDPTLDETRRILVDYLTLLDREHGVAANRQGQADVKQ
jgi:carboxyl-terminal processing protease